MYIYTSTALRLLMTLYPKHNFQVSKTTCPQRFLRIICKKTNCFNDFEILNKISVLKVNYDYMAILKYLP